MRLTDLRYLLLSILIPVGISVCVVVARMIRRKDILCKSGFFHLFLTVSIVDYVFIIWINAFHHLFTAFLTAHVPCWVENTAGDYLLIVQVLTHAAIAVNRYVCFQTNGLSRSLFTGKGTLRVIALTLLTSLAVNAYYAWRPCHFISGGNVYDDASMQTIEIISLTLTFSVCSLVSFCFSVATAFRIWRLRNADKRNESADVRLFMYSVTMLAFQVVYVVGLSVLLPWNAGSEFAKFFTEHIYWFFVFVDLYTTVGPLFLLALSHAVRKRYTEFYALQSISCRRQQRIDVVSVLTTA